jgi:hypothetical protein
MARAPSPSADQLMSHLDDAVDHLRQALEADDTAKHLPRRERDRLGVIADEIAELHDRLEEHDADLARERNDDTLLDQMDDIAGS